MRIGILLIYWRGEGGGAGRLCKRYCAKSGGNPEFAQLLPTYLFKFLSDNKSSCFSDKKIITRGV